MQALLKVMLVAVLVALTGCASVPMAPEAQDAASKQFNSPSKDMAGIYIYRNSSFGGALKKVLKIDGTIIGQTARYTYFYREVAPGPHVIATESEFGDNLLEFTAEAGKNYYFRQYMKMGVFVGGSDLETVTEAVGKEGVLECQQAL